MKAIPQAAARQRIVRFLSVGIGAALLFFALTYAFVSLGMPPFAGALLAYAAAFVVAYSAQRNWTFGGGHDHSHALPRYFVLQAGCALGSGLLAHVAVDTLADAAAGHVGPDDRCSKRGQLCCLVALGVRRSFARPPVASRFTVC